MFHYWNVLTSPRKSGLQTIAKLNVQLHEPEREHQWRALTPSMLPSKQDWYEKKPKNTNQNKPKKSQNKVQKTKKQFHDLCISFLYSLLINRILQRHSTKVIYKSLTKGQVYLFFINADSVTAGKFILLISEFLWTLWL